MVKIYLQFFTNFPDILSTLILSEYRSCRISKNFSKFYSKLVSLNNCSKIDRKVSISRKPIWRISTNFYIFSLPKFSWNSIKCSQISFPKISEKFFVVFRETQNSQFSNFKKKHYFQIFSKFIEFPQNFFSFLKNWSRFAEIFRKLS